MAHPGFLPCIPQPDANADYTYIRAAIISVVRSYDEYSRERRSRFGLAAKASVKMSEWPFVDVLFRPFATFFFLLVASLLWGNTCDLTMVLFVVAPACGFFSFPVGMIYKDRTYDELVKATSRLQWDCWVELRMALLANVIFKHYMAVFLELGTLAQVFFALAPCVSVISQFVNEPRSRLYAIVAWDYCKRSLRERFIDALLS